MVNLYQGGTFVLFPGSWLLFPIFLATNA